MWWRVILRCGIAALLIGCDQAQTDRDSDAMLKVQVWSPSQGVTGLPPVQIGTALTLDCCSKYRMLGRALRRAYELYFEYLNVVRGGILVGGQRRPAELVLIGDNSSKARVKDITRYLINTLGITLLLGPYSSGLTGPAAEVAHELGAVLVAPGSSVTSVFKDRPNVYGTLTPSSRFLDSLFELVGTRPEVGKVATIRVDTSFGKAVCSQVDRLAPMYGIDQSQAFVVSESAEASTVEAIVQNMTLNPPSMLVACVSTGVCQLLITAAEKLGFAPEVLAATLCVTAPDFIPNLGRAGRYIMGLTAWIPSLPLSSSEPGGYSAQSFNELYKNRYKEEPPYQAASAWASAEALTAAIEAADSTDYQAVSTKLGTMALPTLFGTVAFDANGQSVNDFKVVQFSHSGDEPMLIAPQSQAETAAVLPLPQWDERKCLLPNVNNESTHGYNNTGACSTCGDLASIFNNTGHSWHCRTCPAETRAFEVRKGVRVCKQNCPPGNVPNNGICTPCDMGRYSNGINCRKCTRGSFSNMTGQTECLPCPAGSFANNSGAGICTPCNVGMSSPNPGAQICRPCARGAFTNKEGTIDCELCPAGFVSEEEGSSNCTGCAVGKFSQWGGRNCEECKVGRYQNVSARSNCRRCPQGASCPRPGLIQAENLPGFWLGPITRAEGLVLDRCMNPMECLSGGRCREGSTGFLCRTCLPGWMRGETSDECMKCPPFIPNLVATVVLFLLIVVTCFAAGHMVIKAVGKPKHIHPVLLKLFFNYMITMSIMSRAFLPIIEKKRSFMDHATVDWFSTLVLILDFGDGTPNPETTYWSISCLTQTGLLLDEGLVERLQGALMEEFYSLELTSDRDALEAFLHQAEFRRMLFWIAWPGALALAIYITALFILTKSLRKHNPYWAGAMEFYTNVQLDGFEMVRTQMRKDRWMHYVKLFYTEAFGVWRLYPHARLRNFGRGSIAWKRFANDLLPIISVFILFKHGSVVRGVIRPLQCRHLGSDLILRQATAPELTCSYERDTTFLAIANGIFWCFFVPLHMFFRFYKHRKDIDNPAFQRNWGLMFNGFNRKFWWWEFGIFLRKAICFAFIVFNTEGNEQMRVMLFLLLAIASCIATFKCDPYDSRFNGVFIFIEQAHLLIWIWCCIVMLTVDMIESEVWINLFIISVVSLHLIFCVCILHEFYFHLLNSNLRDFDPNASELLNGEKQYSLKAKVLRFFVRQYQKHERREPYASCNSHLTWVSIFGNRGDKAENAQIPSAAEFLDKSGTPTLMSDIPLSPEVTQCKAAKRRQLNYVLKMLHETLEHILVDQKQRIFSGSVIEFILRAGFVTGSNAMHESGPKTENALLEEVEEVVMESAKKTNDPLLLLNSPEEAILQAQGKTLKRSNTDNEGDEEQEKVSHMMELAEDMEMELARLGRDDRKELKSMMTRLKSQNTIPEMSNALKRSASSIGQKMTGGGDEDEENEEDEIEEQEREEKEKQRASDIVDVKIKRMIEKMFEPKFFRRGLTLVELQLSLLKLTQTPRDELRRWLDLFEVQWISEKAEIADQYYMPPLDDDDAIEGVVAVEAVALTPSTAKSPSLSRRASNVTELLKSTVTERQLTGVDSLKSKSTPQVTRQSTRSKASRHQHSAPPPKILMVCQFDAETQTDGDKTVHQEWNKPPNLNERDEPQHHTDYKAPRFVRATCAWLRVTRELLHHAGSNRVGDLAELVKNRYKKTVDKFEARHAKHSEDKDAQLHDMGMKLTQAEMRVESMDSQHTTQKRALAALRAEVARCEGVIAKLKSQLESGTHGPNGNASSANGAPPPPPSRKPRHNCLAPSAFDLCEVHEFDDDFDPRDDPRRRGQHPFDEHPEPLPPRMQHSNAPCFPSRERDSASPRDMSPLSTPRNGPRYGPS